MYYNEETGIVVEVENGTARIRIDPGSSSSCGMGCQCCSAASGGPSVLEVDAGDLSPGDRVEVRIPRINPYLGVLLTFGLPLILFVVGFLIGNNFEGAEGSGNLAVLGGVIGLLLAFLVAWIANRSLTPDEEPVVEKKE